MNISFLDPMGSDPLSEFYIEFANSLALFVKLLEDVETLYSIPSVQGVHVAGTLKGKIKGRQII